VAGSYDYASRSLVPGAPAFVPCGTIVDIQADSYALGSGGDWTRDYRARETPTCGNLTPVVVTLHDAGLYVRSQAYITFANAIGVGFTPQRVADFTGDGMSIVEGSYRLTYAKR
jgi:hypothetical protein